jgi:hypothetical protein
MLPVASLLVLQVVYVVMHLLHCRGAHGILYPVVEIVLDDVAELRELAFQPNHLHLEVLKALLQFLSNSNNQ